jgi:4-hydroxy-2-oxoglutarate aldolase
VRHRRARATAPTKIEAMLLEGIFLPVTTPFYPDGRVYGRKLEHNVERYSRTPAAGLLVLGDVAEASGLTDVETHAVLRDVAASAAKDKVLIAGVGRDSVAATLALSEIAAEAGYDVLAVRAPEFTREPGLHAEVMTYFRALTDRAPLPLLLVSDAMRPVSEEALVELSGMEKVLGTLLTAASAGQIGRLRERTAGVSREVTVTTVFAAATGRMLRPQAEASGSFVSADALAGGGAALATAPPKPALKTRTKRIGFQILAGSTATMLADWRAGAAGAVPRLGACAPQACCEVWQAFRDGDDGLADEKQARVAKPSARMEGTAGIGALKHGCDFNGYFGGRPRLPLLAPMAEERNAIERELAGMRN